MCILSEVQVHVEGWSVQQVERPETNGQASLPSWLCPFLSAAARQQFNQGKIGTSTKPFEATILFGDVVNSSQLFVHYPPAAVVRQLNRFFTVAQTIIHRHYGFTEKLLGDGLLAVFIDAGAALRAARIIQETLADFNAWQPERDERPLLARIALDSGSVILTSLGGPWRLDHTVVGVPVNAASHLLRFARPGEVWFTQATRDRLDDTDLLTEASLVGLKGYARSQTVYRLAGGF
ncbi:MAG: adenylate/guanylate cyclase domain-containing protein [Anaerolineae bacterium]